MIGAIAAEYVKALFFSFDSNQAVWVRLNPLRSVSNPDLTSS